MARPLHRALRDVDHTRGGLSILSALFFSAAIWRESLNWLCAIALLLIIRFGERLPFRSVGIGRTTIKSSLGWGAIIAVVCLVLAGVIVALTHYTGGHRVRPWPNSRSGWLP